MSVKIETGFSAEAPFVRAVAEKVFSAYDGQGHRWNLESVPDIRPIHLAVRAGVVSAEHAGRTVCVKLFYDRSLKGRMRNRLRVSKARRAWNCGIRLTARGIGVPEMIGYAEDASGMGLMMTGLENHALRLDEWIRQNPPTPEAAEALGRFVRKLHDAGVTHKDLSLRNILVKEGPSPDFLLLDYEDARFFRKVSKARRLEDLHHLHERAISEVAEPIRKRFLAAYLGCEEEMGAWCDALNALMKKRPSKYTAPVVAA